MSNITLRSLLKSLVEIDSTSGHELAALKFLEKLLRDEGFTLKRVPVSTETFCIYATVGQPKVVLQAHIDTVKPYVPFSENATHFFGRGTCDTKGSVATMILAAVQAKRKGKQDFGLLFTVEEETTFRGAIATMKSLVKPLPYFIVGEPSKLQPVTSHFGVETFRVNALGKAAHTSTPEAGVNAIDMLISNAYKNVASLQLGEGTLGEVVQISGGIAANIVPAHALFVFSMRIVPGDIKDYFAAIKKVVFPCTVEKGTSILPVQGTLPKQLQFLGEGQTVRYCTELSFFRNGCILGPGDIANAHSLTERVSKKELDKAVTIYSRILEAF